MIIKWENLWYDICNWDNNDGDDNNNICDDNWDNNNIDDIDNGCCGFDNVDKIMMNENSSNNEKKIDAVKVMVWESHYEIIIKQWLY
jgi:hypothetical protein